MAKERPPDWMPSFNYGSAHAPHPSSSAPGLRASRSHSSHTGSPPCSDDESSSTSITNRCSPKAVHVMVSKLSEFKKQLVRDMGFGGILEIPYISKVNLRLSAWLLTKLDTEDSELVFSESRRIYIHEKDVGIVFGIPCGEIDVASMDITPEQIESIKFACGIHSKDSRSFRGVENILEKHLDDRMNWCRYVYGHVLDGAQKAREELIRKSRVTNLFGCHLFLQVLFLDNVDIRGLNKSHRELPRIKLFDAESLKRMAMMCESRGGNDFNSFIGIRPPEVTAYMRHMHQSRHTIPRWPGTPLPPPVLPAGTTQHGPPEVLSAETYSFREHSDFGHGVILANSGALGAHTSAHII
ncbi:unnamed protein product [Urochloa decumbens]|uniref:Uncharacterized protein n=1 Tax=Urochloa decumbens TaxID=240449 RepID=A0ABC8WKR3_9POAL